MNFNMYLKILLVGLCFISTIVFVIFSVFGCQKKQVNYEQIISDLNQKQEENLKLIQKRNREIEKIEHKILTCKKALHIKRFRQKKRA